MRYDHLADAGYEYGPAFQGVQAAWRSGEHTWADVVQPAQATGTGFTLHPALFDAALHAAFGQPDASGVPFSWTGVRIHRTGATKLRVRITRPGRRRCASRSATSTDGPSPPSTRSHSA
ncbi:polyketide synthase dehydratase domain-containing protein [Micromonospora sp. M12]